MFASSIASTLIPMFIAVLKHLDEKSLIPLKPHIGKIICFRIDHLDPLYFRIVDEGLEVQEQTPNHCDTTFSGPMNAFITMILTKKGTHSGLHIKGDIDCAKALYDCWDHLEVDWEDKLSRVVGDNMAHLIMQFVQHSKQWATQNAQARTQDMGAYLQDEINFLPTQVDVKALFQNIDILRHDVERFEAKLHLLQQRMGKQ